MEKEPSPPLSFVETPEMRTLRHSLTPDTNRETFRVSLSRYQQMAEDQIDKLDNEQRSRAQIELIIITAKIYHQTGRDNTEVLEDARDYAEGIRDWNLVDQIEEMIESASA